MNPIAQWVVGLMVAVLLALLGYVIHGMRSWGHVEQQLKDVSDKTDDTARAVKEISARMLTPSDLALAIANVRLEILRDTLQRARERNEDAP